MPDTYDKVNERVTIFDLLISSSSVNVLNMFLQDLRSSSMITDENGRTMPAMKVFSFAIRYLKSQLMNEICLRGKDAETDDIRWVLTVAGFSSEHAKQFVRKAAALVRPNNGIVRCTS